MLTLENLIVQLHGNLVLKSLSCSLLPGRITAFIGKSGAGKTTLLKAMVGLVPKAQGSLIINGNPLTTLSARQRSEEVGYVFQDFNLFAHLTVVQNCIDPLLVHGVPLHQAQQRAQEILTQLGMQNFMHKYPAELSGGQQQRVAIARALCLNPRILLLDEPTASLDPENSAIIALLLKELAQRGIAIGIASHDMAFVRQILDRVYVLQEGAIIEAYDTKIATEIPQDSVLASFFGKPNKIV